jgi:AcrR family transcriptional regulator
MDRHLGPVKTTRGYDATGRQARALAQRDRLIAIAERRFLVDGYATTTMQSIADEAGVSVDTIYKAFTGKPGIIRAIRDRALLGQGPDAAERRSDRLHEEQLDGPAIVRAWGALTIEIAPRVAPILLLVRDASVHDTELVSLLAELDSQRLERMTANATQLARSGHLRKGLGIDAAAHILWIYSAPELYELMVVRQHWTLERYGSFITDAMTNALFSSGSQPKPRGRTVIRRRQA